MARALLEPEIARLEALVDASSVKDVLSCLALICEEKAEHIAATYGDTALADRWGEVSKRIGRLERDLRGV